MPDHTLDPLTQLLHALRATGSTRFHRKDVEAVARTAGLNPSLVLHDPHYRVSPRIYTWQWQSLAEDASPTPIPAPAAPDPDPSLVPAFDPHYVPGPHHAFVDRVVQGRTFFPMFLTGLSGNGKTMMVEQVCARANRELVRVNITSETDEMDLIGGPTLLNGSISYREGPVLFAMRRGAVLLLDECDRGTNKLMCLQAVLEGKPYFIKRTGETVTAAKGFTIIAAGNTKGQGTEDGKFISAQILDEALLERFVVTLDQPYPSAKVEEQILRRYASPVLLPYLKTLTKWAATIRDTYAEGGVSDVISTRRLVHFVHTFDVTHDYDQALTYCLARFSPETRDAFLDLHRKLAGEALTPPSGSETEGVA